MCLILQGSGSLIFSLSSLINSVFADFSSSWSSDARLHLWTDGNIPAFIAELLWEELHWWCDSCGRSFTDDVIHVGGASLIMWFLWEELHWWCDYCGRSFTDDVIIVGGASLKNLSQVFLLWFYLYSSDIFDRSDLLLYIVKIYWSRNC